MLELLIRISAVAAIVAILPGSAVAQPGSKRAVALLAEGDRYFYSDQFEESLKVCLTAWRFAGDPRGLYCAARAARLLGRPAESNAHLDKLDEYLDSESGLRDEKLSESADELRSMLKSDEEYMKFWHKNRPEVSAVSSIRRDGDRLALDILVRNRSEWALKLAGVSAGGVGNATVLWNGQSDQPLLKSGAEVQGTVIVNATEWPVGRVLSVYATIDGTLTVGELVPRVVGVEEIRAKHKSELTDMRAQFDKTRLIERASTLLTEIHESRQPTRLRRSSVCEGSGFVVCEQEWTPFNDWGVLRLVIKNGTGKTLQLGAIEAHDRARSRNHASMVRVGDAVPVASDALQAELSAGQSLSVALALRDPAGVDDSIVLAFKLAGQSVPHIYTVDLRPIEGEGLVTVGLQALGGAVWLANPLDPMSVGATSAAGLALRIRYGFNWRWSLEVELAGLQSGQARWDGMMYEDEQGVVARDATLGRMLASGVVHFGDRYRPLLRLGVGIQGVGLGGRFTPAAGVERDGPGDGFGADLIVAFGFGFEARIGRHLTAGFDIATVGVAKGISGHELSLEGGLRLSYQWTPRR